jgi:hypothetical protein
MVPWHLVSLRLQRVFSSILRLQPWGVSTDKNGGDESLFSQIAERGVADTEVS